MAADSRSSTVGTVLTELGPLARVVHGSPDDLIRPASAASVLTNASPPPDAAVVLVCPPMDSSAELAAVLARVGRDAPRTIVLSSPSPVAPSDLRSIAGPHLVIEAGGTVDPADVVLAVARAVAPPEEAITRRLATLQRSLTQVLSEQEPVVALLSRLKTTCNATIALVDRRGDPIHTTGPVPLALLMKEINQTSAETQMLDVDGWRGVADRVHDPEEGGEHAGWLIVAARRPAFPDSYTTSAVHVSTALIEASQRMSVVARHQERAIRASVLEQAIALQRTPDDPELAGRIASLGLRFDQEARVVVAQPLRSSLSARGRPVLQETHDGLSRAFTSAGIPHLSTVRHGSITMLAQASPGTVRRVVTAAGRSAPPLLIGVGRIIGSIGEVAHSADDARLAVQTLRRTTHRPRLMSYEEFDFATRLFSDVGADRMTEWAHQFLAPLKDRTPLLEGLRSYFDHAQNMNAASEALSIHHNSLRYRLTQVEKFLEISLREPSAVASIFLALAALELERPENPAVRAARGVRSTQPADVEAPRSPADLGTPHPDNLGVVLGP